MIQIMKKSIKRVFFLGIFIFGVGILLPLVNKPLLAAQGGTFDCLLTPGGTNCRLTHNGNHCDPEYLPNCEIWNNNRLCNGSHSCIQQDTLNQCANKEGLGAGTCPAGYPTDCKRGFLCCKTQTDCNNLPIPADYSCMTSSGYGVDTALGCIPASNLNEFVGWFLSKLIFVASGIAFLLMAFGALKIITSAGSPESIQAGKELITSSLAGLIFVILSLFLLKLIGVDILQIPGFGG